MCVFSRIGGWEDIEGGSHHAHFQGRRDRFLCNPLPSRSGKWYGCGHNIPRRHGHSIASWGVVCVLCTYVICLADCRLLLLGTPWPRHYMELSLTGSWTRYCTHANKSFHFISLLCYYVFVRDLANVCRSTLLWQPGRMWCIRCVYVCVVRHMTWATLPCDVITLSSLSISG